MARNLAKIVETPDMAIVLSDGCRLSARTWMPADVDTRPVPAISFGSHARRGYGLHVPA